MTRCCSLAAPTTGGRRRPTSCRRHPAALHRSLGPARPLRRHDRRRHTGRRPHRRARCHLLALSRCGCVRRAGRDAVAARPALRRRPDPASSSSTSTATAAPTSCTSPPAVSAGGRTGPGAGSSHRADIPHVPTGAIGEPRVADLLGTGAPALCWSALLPNGRGRWFALDPLGGVRCRVAQLDRERDRSSHDHRLLHVVARGGPRSGGRPSMDDAPPDRAARRQRRHHHRRGHRHAESVIRYRYHDGRFDGVLHEVCGFGEVEAIEVGDSDVATLVTTRWFSTGAAEDGGEPSTEAERRRARAIRGRIRPGGATGRGRDALRSGGLRLGGRGRAAPPSPRGWSA